MSDSFELEGYHGTSTFCATQICDSGTFLVKENPRHWLGLGSYFFIDDDNIYCPKEKAIEWARSQASKAKPAYKHLSVLKVEIAAEVVLDVDKSADIMLINKLKEAYEAKIKGKARLTKSFLENKCEFFSYLMREHDVDCLIKREYIKTSMEEYELGIDTGVPNCRILCVSQPKKSVKSIVVVTDRERV